MFAYCCNNPIIFIDPAGACAWFFSRKFDCNNAACPNSCKYDPEAKRIAVIYDCRQSGMLGGWILGKGFAHQGNELIKRLSQYNNVEVYGFYNMQEFVDNWNKLSGEYDEIYILAHGNDGGLHCAGYSIGPEYADYSYSFDDLKFVSVKLIRLYCCNGATSNAQGDSVAHLFQELTGATIFAAFGGVNFTWEGCYPELEPGGKMVAIGHY